MYSIPRLITLRSQRVFSVVRKTSLLQVSRYAKTAAVAPGLHQRSAIQVAPCASHFRGVWEILVQCIKEAPLHGFDPAKLTTDIFATITSENECRVISCPLSRVRSSNKDKNHLAPNHLLLYRPLCIITVSTTLKTSA